MYQMEREIAKLQEEAELPRKMERREEIIKSFDELIENIRRVRTLSDILSDSWIRWISQMRYYLLDG